LKQFEYIIADVTGIHARPATVLVKAAKEYKSTVNIQKGDKKADVKRLIALMALGVKYKDKVLFTIEGEDEDIAAAELRVFCEKNL
jgi:phosphocarrier protein